MKRLQRAAVLLSLVEALRRKDSWCGETNLQKACYFLQELAKVPLGFDFVLYKYGPYSFDLTDELTALRADCILALRVRDPKYGPCYGPGELADLLREGFPNTIRRFQPHVDFVASRLGNKVVGELERLATALYVSIKGEPKAAVGERAAEIVSLKPHISRPEAEKAVQAVDQMVAEAQELPTS